MRVPRITLPLIFPVLAAGLWITAGCPLAGRLLHVPLEKKLSRAAGREVRFTRLTIHPLLLSVRINNLRVAGRKAGDPPDFSCDSWTLFPRLVRHGFFSISLGRSEIESPLLRLSLGGPSGPWPRRPLPLLPRHALTVRHGRILLLQGRQEASEIFISEASFFLKKSGLEVNGEGRTPDGTGRGAFSIEADGADRSRWAWSLGLKVTDAPLGPPPFLQQKFPGRWEGRWTAHLQAEGSSFWDDVNRLRLSPKNLAGMKWTVQGEVEDGLWRPAGEAPGPAWGVTFAGTFRVTPQKAVFGPVTILDDVSGRGEVIDYWGPTPSFRAKAEVKGLLLGRVKLSGLPGVQSLPSQGRVSGDVSVSGPVSDLEGRTHLVWENIRKWGVSWPAGSLDAEAEEGSVKARFSWLAGSGSLEGPRPWGNLPPAASWTWSAEKLDLGLLANANQWPRVGGLINARGTFDPAKGEGTVEGRDFEWGLRKETAPVGAAFQWGSDGFSVRGRRDDLRLTVVRSTEGWDVRDMAFTDSTGLFLSGEGSFRDPEGFCQIQIRAREVPVEDIPYISRFFPAATGHLAGEGILSGTWPGLTFSAHAETQDFIPRPGALVHKADAEMQIHQRGFTLSRFTLDGGATVRGSWLDTGWDAEAVFEGADTAMMADLFQSSGAALLAGRLSGSASWAAQSKSTSTLKGDVRCSIGPGRWGVLSFDHAVLKAQSEAGRWVLHEFAVIQSSGAMGLEGYWEPGGTGGKPSWRASAVFQSLNWGPVRLVGEVAGTGEFEPGVWRGQADLHSPRFWVNGIDFGALSGHLSGEKSRWSWTSLSSDQGLSGAGWVDFLAKELDASFEARRWPWGDAVRDLWKRPRDFSPGALSGSFHSWGPWSSLSLHAELDAADIRWRGWPLAMSGSLDRRKGRWETSGLAVTAPDGARMVLEGHFVPRSGSAASDQDPAPRAAAVPASENETDLSLRLEKIPTQKMMDVFSSTRSWAGTWGGVLRAQGAATDPKVELTLSGDAGPAGENQSLFPWSLDGVYAGREFKLNDFFVANAEGRWRMTPESRVYFLPKGRGRFRLVNDLRNMAVGPLRLFGGLEVIGDWTAGPSPSLETRWRAQSLWVNQQYFDQDLVRARWVPGRVDFLPAAAQSQFLRGAILLDRFPQMRFENFGLWEGGAQRLLVQGDVGPGQWDFTLDGWGLAADDLVSLADIELPVKGRWDVQLRGRGRLAAPIVEGRVSGANGAVGFVPYDHLEAQLFLENDLLRITGAKMTRKNGYLLEGEGQIPVGATEEGGGVPSSFHARLSQGKLAVLQDIWADCLSARGAFSGEISMEDGPRGPVWSGEAFVRDGTIRARRYFREMKDLQAHFVLNNDRVHIETLRAKLGAGHLKVSGDAGLRGFSPEDYHLTIETEGKRGIAIEVPQLAVTAGPFLGRFSSLQGTTQGEPRISLTVTGPQSRPEVRGTLRLENTQFTYPPAKGAFAGGSAVPAWWREFERNAFWDIQFLTGKNTWYRNEYVNVQVDGRIHIFGTMDDMKAEGKVSTRQGVINYLGQTFTVKRGLFEIITDTRTVLSDKTVVPFVSGEAERPFTSVDPRGYPIDDTITMIVRRAPLGEIKPIFRSHNASPLDSGENEETRSDKVALRALGISESAAITQAERDQLFKAGLVQLVGASAAPFASRVAHRFGIDMLYPIYEPQENVVPIGNAATPAPTAASPRQFKDLGSYLKGAGASAGVRLSDWAFGVYKVKLDKDKTETQVYLHDEVEVIIRLVGSLHLRASTELDTEKFLGQPPNRQAILENQWRFGLPGRRRKKENT